MLESKRMKKTNLILMYGEDTFSLQNEVRRWRKAFAEKHGGEMNIEVFDKDNAKVENIASSVYASPFLSEKRLVIVSDFMGANNAENQKSLIPILEKLPESTFLLLLETGSPDRRTTLFKKLTSIATIKLFAKPQGPKLNSWIIQRCKLNGGTIDHNSASYLANLLGDNLFRLENEIQKLALYAGENPINISMIDELVSDNAEKSIFQMTDQLARKDIKGALSTLKSLEESGIEAPYLFAMIARQFRLMLEMKSLSEQRMTEQMIASKMKVNPFVVKNTINQCKNFTYGQLRDSLEKLLTIDRRLKTGDLHLRQHETDQYLLALERVIIECK